MTAVISFCSIVGRSMGESSPKRKSKLLTLIVVAVIVIVFISVILYGLLVGTSGTSGTFQLSDPANDVVLSLGTRYPGMVDVVGGGLKVDGTSLIVTINVRDSVSNLGVGEVAQWNVSALGVQNLAIKIT